MICTCTFQHLHLCLSECWPISIHVNLRSSKSLPWEGLGLALPMVLLVYPIRFRHCGYCMLYRFLFTRVVSLYEWQFLSKEALRIYHLQLSLEIFIDCPARVLPMTFSHGTSVFMQPTEWTSRFLQSAGARGSSGWISVSRPVCWTSTTCSLLIRTGILEACHDTVTSFS